MFSIGKRIEELRKREGLTQDDLAVELDVSRQTVSQWEADVASPKADKLKTLCEFFNVKPDYFLFENAAKQPLKNTELVVSEVSPAEVLPADVAVMSPSEAVVGEAAATAADGEAERAAKRKRRKTVVIVCLSIFLLVAAGIALFIAWLVSPPKDVADSVASYAVNFDLDVVLTIIGIIIIIISISLLAYLIVKTIKNKKRKK